MFDFKKKKNDVDDKSVYYEIDKKSRMIIEKYMKKIGLGDITFYELLIMLGFEFNSKLYLKLKQDSNGLIIYYSYDKDNFNKYDYIRFRYMLYRHIMVESKDSYKEYYIKWEYPTGKLCLENEKFYKQKKIDEVEYCITLYNGEFKISIKDSTGREIKFSCDKTGFDRDRILSFLNDSSLLERYIYSVKISDLIEDVFKKWSWILNYLKIDFRNMSLTSLKNDVVVSSYLGDKNNNKLEVKLISDLGELTYVRTILKKAINFEHKSDISIILNNGNYKFYLSYLDDGFVTRVKNEEELINYLKCLRFPIKIEDVCKKINEISLGNLDKYLSISLKVYDNDIRTDVLSLKEGKLDYYQRVVDGKRITIGCDGKFSYKKEDEVSSYSVGITGDVVTRYEHVCEDGICKGDNSDGVMYRAIMEAKEEKTRVRKMVSGLIN